MDLNNEHIEIIKHTMRNGIFCGDSSEMKDLCELGLMELAGRKSFVPDAYFYVTQKGRDLVSIV